MTMDYKKQKKQLADMTLEFIRLTVLPNMVFDCEKFSEFMFSHGVIVLPCAIGDTIYIVGRKYRGGRFEKWINTGKFRLSDLEKIGKTVFLTREEAEKALEEVHE